VTDQKGPPERLPWVSPRITAAPKIRQVYWCEFWSDARLPEMWKTRPVVVMSYKNTLHGPCLVIPVSTVPQDDNPWAHQLTVPLSGSQGWAICNQPSTVSPSRFAQMGRKIPVLPAADFNAILAKLKAWLPQPFAIDNSP
jgi:mRNA interferase MazF